MQQTILVVDDDSINLKLAMIILKERFEVLCANSGYVALELLKRKIPDLILLDYRMPQMNGFEVMEQIQNTKEYKDIPIIFLTGDHDRETEIEALRKGAMDFITKPFVAEIMLQRVSRILELSRLQKNLQEEVKVQTREAQEQRRQVEQLSEEIMKTLANTIDAKDKYTNGHSMRVATYSKEIAKRCGKSLKEQQDIYYIGLLHDIGKIGIPDHIINKPGRLTEEEYQVIRQHPVIGSDILKTISQIPAIVTGARWHHERYDGKGYPDGLSGEDIPESARLIGVADAYDAMTSNRSYRNVLSQELVRAEIEKGKGTQFDPYFAQIMLEIMEEDINYEMRAKEINMEQLQKEIKIDRNELLAVLSEALDRVEIDVFGVTEHHAKRVAWLCVQMGVKLGMTDEEISDLATAALLHDSALLEYKNDYENGILRQEADGRKHCIAGEENLKLIPGYHMLRGYVLYHHECADGSGPFGKTEAETPLGAQLIHIADEVDLQFALGTDCANLNEKLQHIEIYVKEQQGVAFGKQASEIFLNVLSKEQLLLTQNHTLKRLKECLLPMQISFSNKDSNLFDLAELFARIIDYKSPFTKCHSIGIAQKAKQMANSLGWDAETCTKLYFAGALHDIGKLFVDHAILEKPGRLEAEEYLHIQTHADWTWKLLGKIQGFEEIQRWASYHHEKLNGKGYPFGKTAEELGEKERLLACLDIYQALTEDRPYKAGMAHKKAIGILREMVQKEELDGYFVEQIEKEFGNGEMAETQKTALFSCGICGYLHETDALSKGFICPVCGAKETAFSRML